MFHFIHVFLIFWALYAVHFSWFFLSFLIMASYTDHPAFGGWVLWVIYVTHYPTSVAEGPTAQK